MDFTETKRGKGYWKFNNLHLKDKEFLEIMNNTILQSLYNVKNEQEIDLANQWEDLKIKMTEVSQNFSRKKAKMKNELIEKLECKILELDKRLVKTTNLQQIERYKKGIKETEQFLLDEHENRVNAARFRSRAQYFLEGEKNSKYFFNLEKQKGSAKVISQLVREDGTIIKDPNQILKEEKIFYEKLYGKPLTQEWKYSNNTEQILSQEESQFLESELTDMEISESLMGMANSKAPGLDGFTAEFYKVFWIHLKVLYCNVTRFVLNRGLLHRSARLGLITLLPKKDRNLLYLDNWRPLTLLNVDFKIISRAFSIRLKKNVDKLISRNQTGFIQGRNIAENLRTVLDIIQIAKH